MASRGTILAAAAATWIVSVSGAFAQQGSAAEREACTPDAFRLCGHYIPNADAVEACLRNAGPRLSPGCHAVFYPQRAEASPRHRKRHYIRPRDDDDD